MECPFCNIKNTEIILCSSKNVVVIMSNPRLVPGHLLVVPKRHVEKVSELNSSERKELFDTCIEFQEQILKNISTGCDIKQSDKPFLKQGRLKIDHIHFHLLPREFKDELYEKSQKFETDMFIDLTKEEINKFSKLYFLD